MVTCVPWDGGLHCQNTQSRQVLRAHSYQECCRVSFHHTHLLQEIRDKRLDLDAIAEAMRTKAGTTIPSKTTQARAFHSPLITLLTDQMQAHSPAVAEGSAIRALKATSDDLARAREKLQAHGLELTPKKDTGRPNQPSYPTLKDDAPEAWTAPSIQQWMRTFEPKVQEAAQEILRLLQTSKVSTDQLKEAATRDRRKRWWRVGG